MNEAMSTTAGVLLAPAGVGVWAGSRASGLGASLWQSMYSSSV